MADKYTKPTHFEEKPVIWSMEPNGTISCWNALDRTNILYPLGKIETPNGRKSRGGAFVCCPNFGTAPTDGPYAGIELPKHGLVRLAGQDQLNPLSLDEYGWVSTSHSFPKPWAHKVQVSAKNDVFTDRGIQRTQHSIVLNAEADMPYSIGFHPYFATLGGRFTLQYGGQVWQDTEIGVNEPFFIPSQTMVPFTVITEHGTTDIHAVSGYNSFCVWTDWPDLYICVEPVCVGDERRYRMLSAGQQIDCRCTMIYTPTF